MAESTPRIYHLDVLHYLRGTVTYSDAGISSGKKVGTLPNGALIHNTNVFVETAFNAATTNVLTLGTNSSSYNDIVASGGVDETSATGQNVPGATAPLTADKDVFVRYTQTGTAATTGKAHFTIAYAVRADYP